MANQEPKDSKEESGKDRPDGDANPNSKRTPLPISSDYIRKFITAATGSFSNLGNAARVVLTVAVVILAAIVLLWIVDKVVFYYLARSYVNQIANASDLNEHLVNALILLTFITAVFFGKYIWSFSKQKRLIGIAGLSALLIGHSVVLWYVTRDKYFGPRGDATKCYVLTRDGKVTYRERPGVEPRDWASL
jgi:hypothetical protein